MPTKKLPMVEVRAVEHIAGNGSIVDSGAALADALLEKLTRNNQVVVVFGGMKGLSSSYFNQILQRIKQQLGLEIIGHELVFRFDSPAQQLVFDRSLVAVAGNAA